MAGMGRQPYFFALVALATAFLITRLLVAQPGYTDAYYHFNAAERLVAGEGLTDAYLWNYIGAPETLPAPSHLYWMPLTSWTAAVGMWLFGQNYAAAQAPFALMLAATAFIGFWLGKRIGGGSRQAWLAGLLVLFSGFFTRFWGATDTFAPYALIGSLALLGVSRGITRLDAGKGRRALGWFALAGALAGLGHLTRADGLLLLIVGWAAVMWPRRARYGWRTRFRVLVAMTAVYLLVMAPWFVRNLRLVDAPLPLGGSQGIWYTEYNDLFSFPPDANPSRFFDDGLGLLLSSRGRALLINFGTFVVVEGLIAMAPLMLLGLWRRRDDPFLRAMWLYALGLHLAMTLVFPFPGFRGGLLHSSAALTPWWAALGVAGLDDAVDWTAARRRSWNAGLAKVIFSASLLLLALFLSVTTARNGVVERTTPALYTALSQQLPAGARVMTADPAELYYFTGLGGVVLPNEEPEVIRAIARQYGLTHVLVEFEMVDGEAVLQTTTPLESLVDRPPDFLELLPLDYSDARLYAIRDS